MSAAVIAFKAVDAVAIAQHVAANRAAHDEWWAGVQAFAERIGQTQLHIRNGMFGTWVRGYVADKDHKPAPGWRFENSTGVFVPNRRTNMGKKLDAELEDMHWKPRATPGVNGNLHAPAGPDTFSTYLLNGSVTKGNGGDWFLSFGKMPFVDELAKVDPDVWTRATLADFYAQTEELVTA